MQDFTVNFGRMKLGKHELTYDIDASFLSLFDYDAIEQCSSKVNLLIDKARANLLTFYFSIDGTATLPCDRCLDVLPYQVQGEYKFILKLEHQESTDDEIVYLSPDAYEINLAAYIFDFQILSLPFKKDCIRDNHPSCQEVDRILLQGSSDTSEDLDDEEDVDPRWNDLKKLL